MTRYAVCLLSVALVLSACAGTDPGTNGDERAVLVEGTGTYSRPISTDSELAQQFFDQGLRLTWGYHFPEAVASHQEAARHDPDHPMIYWGLALSLGPNPNSRFSDLPDDPQGEARKAIERAMELRHNGTDVERQFVEALHVRFDADTHPDREERDQAYLVAARALAEAHPDDPDAGALLGDAYMITRPGRFYWDEEGEPLVGTAEAAAALEEVMRRHPDHPGGNHLYIHLYESSHTPGRALDAADRLGPLMPGVGHVVHMPSHIYVRTGQHVRAYEQNQRSAEADAEFLAAWGDLPFPQTGTYFLSAQNHRRHSYDFMRYSAAVLGRYAQAFEAATNARAYEPEKRIQRGAADKTIASRWLVHKMFGRWAELRAEERVHEGAHYMDGLWHYTQGSASVGLGELEDAAEHLARLEAIAEDPASAAIRRNMNPASDVLKLAAFGLEGEIRQAKGDLPGAIAAFRSAVEIQDGLAYTEPPDWPQPMRQYLGAALLESGDAGKAEEEYRLDLETNPDDGWTLFGLWQSLEIQGKTDEAREVRLAFEGAWKGADVELTRSRF